MSDTRWPDRLLTWTQDQRPSANVDTQLPRDDLESLFLIAMYVPGNLPAGRGKVVKQHRPVFCISGRFDNAEPVPKGVEIMAEKRPPQGVFLLPHNTPTPA